jgi:hypothetical protein
MDEMMERERGWGGEYGGVLSLHVGQQIERHKKYKNKICCGFRWPRYNILHAATNQKHMGAMEQVYVSRCDQGGACTGDETIIWGGIRS